MHDEQSDMTVSPRGERTMAAGKRKRHKVAAHGGKDDNDSAHLCSCERVYDRKGG